MFPRLAEQYRALARDLVMSLQALAKGLQERGHVATCYVCGDEQIHEGASFVADLGERHTVRFLVSDSGISWVECRDGCELVRFEGAEAIHELQRLVLMVQEQECGDGLNEQAERGPATSESPAISLTRTRRRSGRAPHASVA
jgi:Mn-dependent DtxR family transcriptional regulator